MGPEEGTREIHILDVVEPTQRSINFCHTVTALDPHFVISDNLNSASERLSLTGGEVSPDSPQTPVAKMWDSINENMITRP